MPFFEETQGDTGFRTPGLIQPPDEPAPEGSLWGAAARMENVIVSAYQLTMDRAGLTYDFEHNPIDIIKGTRYEANYLDRFVDSISEADTRSRMARIDREEQDRAILDAGGWAGFGAQVAMGMLDPSLLIPVGTIYKGAKVGRAALNSALSASVATGAMVAGQEAILYGTQETRTPGESTLNIASGVILGGILGGAAGALTAKEYSRLTGVFDGYRKEVNAEFAPGATARASEAGAAANVRRGLTQESAFGAEKAGEGLSPVTRLQGSPFEAARAVVRDMGDAGLSYRENWEGVPTSEGGTVETRVKMRRAPMIESIAATDDAYARYFFDKTAVSTWERRSAGFRSGWARVTGRAGGKLGAHEFREEVGKAARRGDNHPIPQVAEAAKSYREKVFEPLKKEAVELGLLPDDLRVLGADSYLTRLYNRDKIRARTDEWLSIFTRHLHARRSADEAAEALPKPPDPKAKPVKEGEPPKPERPSLARMSDAELADLAEEVTNTILGESAFRLPGLSIVQGARGPLKARVLDIPDAAIEDFLESDIERVARAYTNTMAADIELTAKFGDPRMEEALNRLKDEFNAKRRAATSEAARLKLARKYDRARADIEALRDRVRGVYRLPEDPDGLLFRAGKAALNLNYLARMGGVTVSSLPDVARPVMRYGLNAFKDGWLPMIRSLDTFKLAAREVRLSGTALEMVRDQRAMEMADVLDDYGRNTKFERGVQWAADRMALVNMMAPWNGTLKSVTGVVTMANVVRAARAVSAGNATKKQVNRLAQSGIDDAMARRIWAEAERTGTDVNGVFLPNTEGWGDLKAVSAFRAAINREVESLIVTPGLEKPLWMSHPLGRVMGQFKSFAMVSTQRTLIAGLQQRDAAALSGVLVSLSLGAMVAKIKAELRGEDTGKWNAAQWAQEALDNSGLLGVLMEANAMAEKVSRGRAGLSVITGKQVGRYAARGAVGSLFGPTADFAADALTLGALGSDDWSRADTRALRKIVPFQNLFYVRSLFDRIEEGVNDRLNIPQTRPRR